MKRETKSDPENTESRLREACFKLRSLGHLLGRQQDDGFTELDEADIWYGLGLIVQDIHDDVLEVARDIGEQSIKAEKKNKS